MRDFTLVTPITAKAYCSAAWLYFFAKNKYTLAAFLLGSGISAAVILLYALGIYTDMFMLLCALAVAACLFISVMMFAMRLSRVVRTNQDLFTRSLKLRFTQEGFHAMGREMDAFFEKKRITRVIETKQFLHLYLDRGRAQVSITKADLQAQTAYDLDSWLKDIKR